MVFGWLAFYSGLSGILAEFGEIKIKIGGNPIKFTVLCSKQGRNSFIPPNELSLGKISLAQIHQGRA